MTLSIHGPWYHTKNKPPDMRQEAPADPTVDQDTPRGRWNLADRLRGS